MSTTPLAAEVLSVGTLTGQAQAQLKALSAALALVSTSYVSAGTTDLSHALGANIASLNNVLVYYTNYFAVLNGNATS